MLTEEEYFEEGVRETAVALEQLRSFCASPECKQWDVVQKMKNPGRFAEFMRGASHLTDEEMMSYEVDRQNYITESEGSEISEDESEYEKEYTRHVGNGSVRRH